MLHQLLERSARVLALPGFQAVQRFWDSGTRRWTARVLPGKYYVTRSDEAISAVLGSCIAACITDRSAGIGGMNHFMLPQETAGDADNRPDPGTGPATRYGRHAMESLINALVSLGANRQRLEVKLFGAGRIVSSGIDESASNIAFVHEYLEMKGLKVVAADLGNIYPRRIIYFPATGKVWVRRLSLMQGSEIATRERCYLDDIARWTDSGDVELIQ